MFNNEICVCKDPILEYVKDYNGKLVIPLQVQAVYYISCSKDIKDEIQSINFMKLNMTVHLEVIARFKTVINLNIKNKKIQFNSTILHNNSLSNAFLTTVIIKENNLEIIDEDSFQNLKNLKMLSLGSNSIQQIKKNAFRGIQNVQILYLNDNKLSSIAKEMLINLVNIIDLRFHKNQITQIEKNSFSSLSKLERLTFNSNKIKKINASIFSNFPCLTLLWLNQNEIDEIEVDSFTGLSSLIQLRLESNELKKIHGHFFKNIQSLETLFLNNNEISEIDIDSFSSLINLQGLTLYSNKITTIKFGLFANLNQMTELYLKENEINTIAENSFDNFTTLLLLDLSFNRLNKIENGIFKKLVNLQQLILSYNQIQSLQQDALSENENLNLIELDSNNLEQVVTNQFFDLKNLETIKLNFNNLISLAKSSFNNLPNLVSINLANNYLDGLNFNPFEGDLTNLNEIFLQKNYIKILAKNFFDTKSLINLKKLYLGENGLKSIEAFCLQQLKNLEILDLNSNKLEKLNEYSLYNLSNLNMLDLSFNRINSMEKINMGLSYLRSLETIDLSSNSIEFINENNFNFSLKLRDINLNENKIRFIHSNTFLKLRSIVSLKISKNNLENFDLNVLNSESIQELDLSFNNISLTSLEFKAKSIKKIVLEKVNFVGSRKIDFKNFLDPILEYLDYSNNRLNDFEIFDNLTNLITLKLKNVNLESMSQIKFDFKNLTHLDLSYNKIMNLTYESFKSLQKLEHLDMRSNRISFIDAKIFDFSVNSMNKFKFINFDDNLITTLGASFTNFFKLETFSMKNNSLNEIPTFETLITGTFEYVIKDFYFQLNKIKIITVFPIVLRPLRILNLDYNQICLIENKALFNLKDVENLSISDNNLSKIKKDNFNYLYKLKYLNLSFNSIEHIEEGSFLNLNKLYSLDLSFNKLASIEANIFTGLTNLNDMYLYSYLNFTFNSKSFANLPNLGSIYLEEITVKDYKCFFMHSFFREVKRNVYKGKYIFYKSLNLVSPVKNGVLNCDLIFSLFQFKIHFNLKYDYQNELFFQKCGETLTRARNSYEIKNKSCYGELVSQDDSENQNEGTNRLTEIFTNGYFYIVIGLILAILTPGFVLICIDYYQAFNKKK
jgi:Leucine-rich repeat (LRR) protein